MTRLSRPTLVLGLLALAACGGDDEPDPAPVAPTPPAAPAEAPEPEAATEDAAGGAMHIGTGVDRAAARAARRGAAVRERGREVRERLRAAREATRGGDHVAALPLFEAALRLAPSDEQLLCETGYVALRAERLDRAQQLIDKALRRFGSPQEVSEAMRVPLAMCLYNAGRVAEAREQTTQASLHYRTSLSLRDNRIVRERLAAVGGAGDAPARPPAAPTVDALLAAVRTEVCESAGVDASEEDAPCDASVGSEVESGGEGFAAAALLSVQTGDLGGESYLHLGVREADGWRDAGVVLYVYNPGAFGISEEGNASEPVFEQLIAGGDPELRIEVTHDRTDIDMGVDEEDSTHTETTVVCGRVDGAVRCARLLREMHYERGVLGMAQDGEEIEHEGLPIEEHTVIEVSFDGEAGTVTMQPTEGELPERLQRWRGTHPLVDVLRSDDFALGVL